MFELWDGVKSVRSIDTRVAAYLLPAEAARALGVQVMICGTRKSAVRARYGGEVGPGPLGAEHRHVCGEVVTNNLWKPHELLVGPLIDEPHPAELTEGWGPKIATAIKGLLQGNGFTQGLRRSGDDRLGQHACVRGMRTGSVVRLSNRLALVVSNELVHQNHPYGTLLVAPVIASSPAAKTNSLVIGLDGARVAWELTQGIDPKADWPLSVVQAPNEETIRCVELARIRFLQLVGGHQPEGVRWPNFIQYLSDSAREFSAGAGPMRFSVLPDPFLIPFQPVVVHSESDLPNKAGFYTTGAPLFGGEDQVGLDLPSERFAYWLQRREDRASLVVESLGVARPTCVEVQTFGGAFVAEVNGDQADEAGVLEIPLGRIDGEHPTDISFEVLCGAGFEEHYIRHRWVVSNA